MNEIFFKFPSTPHLAVLGKVEIRSDKVMTDLERDEFLRREITIEEKIDGANLGISFDGEGELCIQNRGALIFDASLGQWKKLEDWLNLRVDLLFEHLVDRYILFGEWCYAKHSVYYNKLPDWFLGFDIFDKRETRFLSYDRRNLFFKKLNIQKVPTLGYGKFKLSELNGFIKQSKYGDEPAEGVYLRYDVNAWLCQRAKLVRAEFIQAVEEHWSKSLIVPNRLNTGL